MTDVFTQPDDGGDLKSSDFTTSMSDRLGAQWADTLDPKDSLSGMWIARTAAQGIAGGNLPHDYDIGVDADSAMQLNAINEQAKAAIPDISRDDAQDLLKQEGLSEQDVYLGDAPTHKLPVLKMQIDEAHARRDRAAAIARGPQGFFPDALGTVTSIGVGMIDPVNAAAFSIPVLGEARLGKIMMSAGDSIPARGAIRFGQGAAQGAVGTAVLQPADWWLHTRDGQDYTMAQAMESVIMGAGMGGAFHGLHGGLTDYMARRNGLPLPGSPQDLLLRGLMTGTHVPATALADEGVPLEEIPGIGPVAARPGEGSAIEPLHPAEILADLPTPVRQDAVHAAMADIISGRPTQAAEMLNIAADHDPRIAESLDASAEPPRKMARGRAAADPATWSLYEHLASEGGLKPDPDLRAIFGNDRGPFVPGFGPLLRRTGKSLDDALTTAKEGGYFIDPTDPAHAPAGLVAPEMQGREATFGIRDLLEKIDEESRGRRQYRANHLEDTKYDPAQEHHVILGEIEHEIAKSGAKVEDIDPRLLDRTVEIVKRDGETDVLAAYERAIMEDAERYDATAHERRSNAEIGPIPGWDPPDVGATPRDGGGGDGERGQAGRPDQGPRAADGAQSSGVGRGNRSSPAVVAADPRWRQLADTTPDYNEPDVLAESAQAADTPEPASVSPQKSLSALEKAASDAEEVWRRLEPTLTEDERKAINDAFANQEIDKNTKDRMIVDGVACLMGAIA